MGLDIANLAGNVADVEIKILDETATITYRPAVVTVERLETLGTRPEDRHEPTEEQKKAGEPGHPSEVRGLANFFIDAIESWDITSGGKKVPITEAGIRTLPLFLQRAIYNGIMEALADGTGGKGYRGTSRQTATTAKSRSGTRSSRRRATSASLPGT